MLVFVHVNVARQGCCFIAADHRTRRVAVLCGYDCLVWGCAPCLICIDRKRNPLLTERGRVPKGFGRKLAAQICCFADVDHT